MALFGKKPAKDGVPVPEVQAMKSQGMDNNRIIQTLQRDGYSSSQIFEAMNQSDMTPAVSGASPEEVKKEVQSGSPPMDSSGSPASPQASMTPQEQPVSSGFKQPNPSLGPIPNFQQETPRVEEIVESIIEEKWEEIVRDISKIVEWKNTTDSKLTALEHDFASLKDEFDKLHQAVIGKIGEYDRNILNVGAEVKAMEKVFSKVLPVFTEKVNQLSDVADSFKNIKKK
ncbi:hypothetical protein ACFLTH_15570 [Bacteroidota bacterium]